MPFPSLVLGGGDHYHRIAHVREQSLFLEEDSDVLSLLKDPDFYNAEEEHQQQQQLRFIPRNRTLAVARKPGAQPESDIKLSIRRMDDTTFVIAVARKATVSDLKAAVQKKFESSQVGGDQISWPHVWGNFCLSFRNQKLIDENALLNQLGIRGNDQLYFVRHLATRLPGEKCHSQKRSFFNGLRKKHGLST